MRAGRKTCVLSSSLLDEKECSSRLLTRSVVSSIFYSTTIMVFFKRCSIKHFAILIVFQSIGFSSAEEIWTPKLIKQTLDDWKQRYPKLVRVATAQEMFGLPSTGISSDCPYDDNNHGCDNQFFTIQG